MSVLWRLARFGWKTGAIPQIDEQEALGGTLAVVFFTTLCMVEGASLFVLPVEALFGAGVGLRKSSCQLRHGKMLRDACWNNSLLG